MTSKHFYSKMLFNTMRRHIWYGAVLLLLYFIVSPLYMMMNLTNVSLENAIYYYDDIAISVSGMEGFNGTITAIAAMLAAWVGLGWLHNKKKMDLYGSLPIRREYLVLNEFLVSFILFLSAYVLNHLLTIGVAAAYGMFNMECIPLLFKGLLVNGVFYILFYLTAATAMLMTGKILVAILGTGVFLGIFPAILLIMEALHSTFYKTYIFADMLENLMMHASPVTLYAFTLLFGNEQIRNPDLSTNTYAISDIRSIIIVTVVSILFLIGLNYWLIRKRPVESAEKAMAFKVTEGPIKAILLYVSCIGGGIFFYNIVYQGSTWIQNIWLWFGLIFTFVIAGIIIDVIYERGIRHLFSHKIWTAAGGILAVFTVCFFLYDMAGYDHWIPNKNEIKNATVFSDRIANGSYWQFEDGSDNVWDYLMNNREAFTYDNVVDIAELGVRYMDRPESYDDTEEMAYVRVNYELTNGKIKKRIYSIPVEACKEIERWYLEKPERRKVIYPVLQNDPERLTVIELYGSDEDGANYPYDLSSLSGNELDELKNIYLSELSTMDTEVLLRYDEEGTWGYIYIMLEDEESPKNGHSIALPFNEDFVKTQQYLKDKQIEISKEMY